MKQSYNIEVAGVNLNIISTDGPEFVESTVAELEASVQKMLRIGTNYSKLDALILCALDYLGELSKAESKIKNLEAQIAILEAGRRIRGEADEPAARADEKPAAKADEKPAAAAEPAEEPAKEESAPAEEPANESSRDAKFRQLEALLGSQLKIDLDND